MAAYAHYRHVELDKVGCGKKRIVKTVAGGEPSEIFGSSPNTTPPTTPRKVKNYMASNIFTPEGEVQVHVLKSRSRPDDDSFKRLFGNKQLDITDGGPTTPRIKNYQKSSIICHENNMINGHAKANGHTNGHTGNGTTNGNSNNGHGLDSGLLSGSSSGSSTPSSGSVNGDHLNNGHYGFGTPTRRIPPGGYSSKLW